MISRHRLVKPVLVLLAAGLLVLAVSGCAFVKPKSLALSQPQGIGSVRVHFNLCTLGGEEITENFENVCGPNEEPETLQYLIGIAVPPGSVPPASFTATPVGGGTPIVFSRNDEVATQMAPASGVIANLIEKIIEPEDPEEIETVAKLKELLGKPWPPSGLQAFGYLSEPVNEAEGATQEWSVDADFGLPSGAGGAPFAGPFVAAIAYGLRAANSEFPPGRPIHCLNPEAQQPGDAVCLGGLQEAQVGTADLKIAGPAKPAKAFVGGSGQLAFSLKYAGAPPAVPSFALSATTTAKGGKAKPASATFTPTGPTGSDKVTVSVPKKTKPGTYQVTLTAQTPQGGVATGVGTLKVTKPKLKLGKVKLNPKTGTATLKVKVPSGGKLTISGKGVRKVK
jgi:hypothetical protein